MHRANGLVHFLSRNQHGRAVTARAELHWREVCRDACCAICGKPDWCAVGANDREAVLVLCMRFQSDRPSTGNAGGWLHRVDGNTMRSPIPIALPKPRLPRADIEAIARNAYEALTGDQRNWLANDLGCTTNALVQLCVGFDRKNGAFTFPMRDARMWIVGIRMRAANGKKWSVKGGREGMFLAPRLWKRKGPVLLPEGASDAAALVEHFDVVGRPSCSGAVQMTTEVCAGRVCVVIADHDVPGQKGATVLAAALRKHASDVCVVWPPVGHKDVREWFAVGGTIEEMRALLARRGKPLHRTGVLPSHLTPDDAMEVAVRQYQEDDAAVMTWLALNR